MLSCFLLSGVRFGGRFSTLVCFEDVASNLVLEMPWEVLRTWSQKAGIQILLEHCEKRNILKIRSGHCPASNLSMTS